MKILAQPAFSNRAVNPYTALLYDALEKQGDQVVEYSGSVLLREDYDILHIHWPDNAVSTSRLDKAVLNCLRLWLRLKVAHGRGLRVVWTAHNLKQHEALHPRLESWLWYFFLRNIDGIISLNCEAERQLRGRLRPRSPLPIRVIPHGHYRGVYPNRVSRAQARSELNLPDTDIVFAWVGQIRPYKGLPELVDAWRRDRSPGNSLLIAGKVFHEALHETLQQGVADDPRIRYHPGWLEDERIQYYLNASDAVLLPYQGGINSGSAFLALSFNRPVVMPDTPALRELQEMVGADWIHLYEGAFHADVLRDARAWLARRTCGPAVSLDAFDWDRLAEQTLDFFREVAASSNGK